MDTKPTLALVRQHQPIGWYYRKAIRNAATKSDLRALALILLDELEDHRKAFREFGYGPPLKHDPIVAIGGLNGKKKECEGVYREMRMITDAFTREPIMPRDG